VRLLLEYPQLAQTQLAALLQLAQEHPIRLLVPMSHWKKTSGYAELSKPVYPNWAYSSARRSAR